MAATIWERVAETPSNAPAPLTARQDEGIVRAYDMAHTDRGPRVCDAANGAWILGRHVCPVHASNGIIRAGERIK